MRPLSQSLADMSARAKSVEDKAAAAQKETHEEINARIQQAKADAQRRADAVTARGSEVAQDVSARWAGLQAALRTRIDGIHDAVAERRDEHDAKVMQRRAESAEEEANVAIDFALSAIVAAEEAVLEAIDARAQADAVVPAGNGRAGA